METVLVYYVSFFPLLIHRVKKKKSWQVDLFLSAMCEMKVEYVRLLCWNSPRMSVGYRALQLLQSLKVSQLWPVIVVCWEKWYLSCAKMPHRFINAVQRESGKATARWHGWYMQIFEIWNVWSCEETSQLNFPLGINNVIMNLNWNSYSCEC